jgi:hypothetical protein
MPFQKGNKLGGRHKGTSLAERTRKFLETLESKTVNGKSEKFTREEWMRRAMYAYFWLPTTDVETKQKIFDSFCDRGHGKANQPFSNPDGSNLTVTVINKSA